MVVYDQTHGNASPHYGAVSGTSPQRRPPSGGGLVKSRAQFFEALESQRTAPKFYEEVESQRTGRKQMLPPKHAVLPATSQVIPLKQYEQRQPESTPSPSSLRTTTAPTPSAYRHRYQDSFSNELPMINESRQEDFPATTRSSSTRSGSPLLEAGLEHYNRGEYVLAEKAFMTALKTQQANMSPDDKMSALIMGNLGAVYLKQNKIKEAMQFLETSLAMKKSVREDVMMADTYNNLGNCANMLGKYDDSIEYYRLALQELRKKRGQKSDVADTLFNIGRLEIYRQNFETARGVLSEALRMANEVYGEDHIYVAEASDLMGFVQISLGQYDDALISFTKSLEIHRNLHGPLNVDVAHSIYNIGMVRESTGELSEAWEAYNTSQDLYRRLGTPPEDPGFRTVRRSVANVEKVLAQQTQARLVQKHYDALKKKKKLKEKRDSATKDPSIVPVSN